jgi:hypothetical protein
VRSQALSSSPALDASNFGGQAGEDGRRVRAAGRRGHRLTVLQPAGRSLGAGPLIQFGWAQGVFFSPEGGLRETCVRASFLWANRLMTFNIADRTASIITPRPVKVMRSCGTSQCMCFSLSSSHVNGLPALTRTMRVAHRQRAPPVRRDPRTRFGIGPETSERPSRLHGRQADQ